MGAVNEGVLLLLLLLLEIPAEELLREHLWVLLQVVVDSPGSDGTREASQARTRTVRQDTTETDG